MTKKDSFGFGNKPRMQEVPPGTEATFRFNGDPQIIETEKYGQKYSFPITLITHDSHPLLTDGPMEMDWESKSDSARKLYNNLNEYTDSEYYKKLKKAYDNEVWQLTRFDTGVYWLDLK